MKPNHDQSAAHNAADVVDNVADGIRSAAHTVGGTVRSAAQTVRQTAARSAGAVGHACEEVTQHASDSFHRTRTAARSWERRFESSVRDNPKTSLLVAAALGLAIGSWCRRK